MVDNASFDKKIKSVLNFGLKWLKYTKFFVKRLNYFQQQ